MSGHFLERFGGIIPEIKIIKTQFLTEPKNKVTSIILWVCHN